MYPVSSAAVTKMPGKTETLCRLVLCLVLMASLHLATAEPGHLVHKYFRNQIAAEEVSQHCSASQLEFFNIDIDVH